MFSPRLDEIEQTYTSIEDQLADPAVLADHERFVELSKRYAELGEVVHAYRGWKAAQGDLEAGRQLLREERSPEGRAMLEEELRASQERIDRLETELRQALAPKDPNDDKDVIVEIRAGTGGDEAALFAGDLFRMYSRWAEQHGYKVEILSQSLSDLDGGFKEVIFSIHGKGAWSRPSAARVHWAQALWLSGTLARALLRLHGWTSGRTETCVQTEPDRSRVSASSWRASLRHIVSPWVQLQHAPRRSEPPHKARGLPAGTSAAMGA